MYVTRISITVEDVIQRTVTSRRAYRGFFPSKNRPIKGIPENPVHYIFSLNSAHLSSCLPPDLNRVLAGPTSGKAFIAGKADERHSSSSLRRWSGKQRNQIGISNITKENKEKNHLSETT